MRNKWTYRRAKVWLSILASIGGILTAIAKYDEIKKFLLNRWESIGTVTLKGSYPGEHWNHATGKNFGWLTDDWCYPSIPDFKSRFKVEGDRLFRQNEGKLPTPFRTDWIPIKAYRSNRNTLQLVYPKEQDWPIDFVEFHSDRTAEWHEYTRAITDEGTVVSNKRRLVLSCKRCKVDAMGIVYECKEKA